MNTPALTKTRVAVSALMATATLASAGLATTLALSRHQTQESVAAPDTSVRLNEDSHDQAQPAQGSTKHRTSRNTTGFAPSQQAGTSSSPSHTRTKGS